MARIVAIVRKIQRPDGGFDIGYAFNFGLLHAKGESTAPESLMLVPLILCKQLEFDVSVTDVIERGIRWILERMVYVDERSAYMPYGPDRSKDVIVYNGTSFAQAPLSMWGSITGRAALLQHSEDMVRYLAERAFSSGSGLVMPYSEPRIGMLKEEIEKIDYYHLAQQAEMHFLSARWAGSSLSRQLAVGFATTLRSLSSRCDVIPYLNNGLFHHEVHAWGLASTVAALVDAFEFTGDRSFLDAAAKQYEWLSVHALRDDTVVPVLAEDGRAIDQAYYPRSDAWVVAALSKFLPHLGREDREKGGAQLERIYQRIARSDFSGYDNHASTRLRLVLSAGAKKVLGRA